MGVWPEPASVTSSSGDITFLLNYSISHFDESLAPYTISLQFRRDDGKSVGPAFGNANVVIGAPAGQARLVVTAEEILSLDGTPHLARPITGWVIIDHAEPSGTEIIGKSALVEFSILER
jgi:hypothetical protein